MKLKIRKILSVFLVFAMMIGMMPNIVTDVHAATIKDIDISITEPVVGEKPTYYGTVNNSDKYYNKCIHWFDAETDVRTHDPFISGRTYRASIVLTSKEHFFSSDGVDSFKVNGKTVPPEITMFEQKYSDGKYRQIRINAFFTMPGPKHTKIIEIDGTRPTANQTPKYDYKLSNLDTSEYELYEMNWIDSTSNKVMGSTDKFISDHYYDLVMYVRGIDGNTFLPVDELTAKVDGESAECMPVNGEGDNVVSIKRSFYVKELEGTGTKDDPYVVYNRQEFSEAFAFDGVYVKLGGFVRLEEEESVINVDATLDLNNQILSTRYLEDDGNLSIFGNLILEGPGELISDLSYYGDSKLIIDDGIEITGLLGSYEQATIVLNHPEAYALRADVNTMVLESGTLDSICDSNKTTLIMRGGIWRGIVHSGSTIAKHDYALYGGRIDTTEIEIFGEDLHFYKNDVGRKYLADYGNVLNTFYAFSLDGDKKKCTDMDDLVSAAKEYGTFDVYAPCFVEQAPSMPEGSKTHDLGTIEATSYPITFKSNKLPEAAKNNGFIVDEYITVTDSNGEIVDFASNNFADGEKGISYDLKNLPEGKYTITEEIVTLDNKKNKVFSETNTFTVNWKPVEVLYNISGSISGVENTTKTDVEVYKYNSGRYEYMKKVTLTGNSSYQINSLPLGNYKLVAKANGYLEKSYQFRLESNAKYNFTMQLEKITGNAFYTSATSVGKAVNVSLGGNISSVPAAKRNYQWQISNNGTSGWTNISGATTNPWTIPADAGYVGKFIRVVVTADGYNGEVVSPAAEISKQTNMFEVPETPALTKNTEGTSITIANYQNDQEYVVSTSSTPNWENDMKFTGATLTGLTTNTIYYVHTRMKETNMKQAGHIVRTSNISLAKSVYLNGIDVVAEKTVAESGEVVKITINPVPSNATGFDGAKVYLSYGAKAKLYSNAACTSQILSGNTSYFKTVYLKGTDAETVTVSAERSAGNGMPYMDNVKIEIADAEGNFAFGSSEISVKPNTINISRGGTTIVDLYSYMAPEKPIANATWTHASGDNLNGLSFERIGDSNQYLVKASDTCSVGTGYYNVTVNGTKQVNSLRVNVTANTIPVENVSVTPSTLTLDPEATYNLAAVITPTNATSNEIIWSSSDETIATVDANGNVTAVALGSATITATVDAKTATCTVTVVSEEYSIDVTNGIASVSKARPGEVITLIANEAPEGKIFDKWVVTGATVADALSDVTTFTMPENNVTVTATYKSDGTTPSKPKTHLISVIDGVASKYMAKPNEKITITADKAPEGSVFDKWLVTGATVDDETSATTTFTMPYEDVYIEATYKEFKPFPFEDVFEGQWYYEYVNEAYQLGLMTGATETLFKPTVSMNRGMVAIVLHRMEGEEHIPYAPIFPDVYDNQYFTTAVMWAKQTGIITGYNNGTFMPLKNVTREEMATMIQRFAKYKGLDVTSNKDITYFEDYANITAYAREPIQWCVENGVISGKFEGTKVDPLGTATRAECAKMLAQAYKVIYK